MIVGVDYEFDKKLIIFQATMDSCDFVLPIPAGKIPITLPFYPKIEIISIGLIFSNGG